jgi:hypothetical protein
VATCNPDVYAGINDLTSPRRKSNVVINTATGGGVTGDVSEVYDTGELPRRCCPR